MSDDTKAFACASDNGYQEGMDLRDYFAIHCPEPNTNEVLEIQRDNCRDNIKMKIYKDHPILKIEEEIEIRAMLRYKYADAMMKLRSNGDER